MRLGPGPAPRRGVGPFSWCGAPPRPPAPRHCRRPRAVQPWERDGDEGEDMRAVVRRATSDGARVPRVIVVGGGAAGLAAAAELCRLRCAVVLVEARDRLGGELARAQALLRLGRSDDEPFTAVLRRAGARARARRRPARAPRRPRRRDGAYVHPARRGPRVRPAPAREAQARARRLRRLPGRVRRRTGGPGAERRGHALLRGRGDRRRPRGDRGRRAPERRARSEGGRTSIAARHRTIIPNARMKKSAPVWTGVTTRSM